MADQPHRGIADLVAGFLSFTEEHTRLLLRDLLGYFVDFGIQLRPNQVGHVGQQDLKGRSNLFWTTLNRRCVKPLIPHIPTFVLGESLNFRQDRVCSIDPMANLCKHVPVDFRFEFWKIGKHLEMLAGRKRSSETTSRFEPP